MALYKIQASRVNNIEAQDYTGSNVEEGQIWYDPVQGVMRLYNGAQGGYIINTGGSGNVDLSAVSQNIVPSADVTYTLGSATNRWKELYVGNGSVYIGDVKLSNRQGTLVIGDVTNRQDLIVTGNVSATNFIGNGSLLTGTLPNQTGQQGKYLSTDGTSPSWQDVAGVFGLVIDGGNAVVASTDFVIDAGGA